MHKEVKIEIFGRVQGVNYRRSVMSYANKLGLTGYAENRKDGSVLIIAQGEEEKLDELVSWCPKGVYTAKITGMSYDIHDAVDKYRKFTIKTDKTFWSDEVGSLVNLGKQMFGLSQEPKIPNHVAIIPDGNRRWAREKGWHPWIGHRRSLVFSKLESYFNTCKNMGINYFSLWGFSTENWDRDPGEIKMIFDLFRENINNWRTVFMRDGIRFRHMGRKDRLPADVVKLMTDLEIETKDNTTLNFQLCLDYGGRDDLVRAFNKMIEAGISAVDEKVISEHLDSHGIPDPDLIIRTSGEKRTSGIMAYQATYAELYFTEVYFPDFDSEQFKLAVLDYSARVRRFGGTAKEDLQGIDLSKLYDPEHPQLHT